MTIPVLVPHVAGCTHRGFGHTDAAKRVSDAINLHSQASDAGWTWENVYGKWMAFKLENGSTDRVLYDRKVQAVRHQSDEFICMYLRMGATGMTVCEAEIMLKLHRQAYARGFRWYPDRDDPGGGRQIIPRLPVEKRQNQLRALGGQ